MDKIKLIINNHYGIEATSITAQQGGWSALAYQVAGAGQTYFLKVYEKSRASTSKWTALIDSYMPVMVWLFHNSGLQGKIPVLFLDKNGNYKCEDDYGIYLLYEYIEGETIGSSALTEAQVRQLAEIVAELHLHGEEIPVKLDALREDFSVPFLQELSDMADKEAGGLPSDVRELVRPYAEQMQNLINSVGQLSAALKHRTLSMVLCHTDLHNWNLMQAGQQLLLIDWEGLKLAPVEADMMFLTDKPYYEEFMRVYRRVHPQFVLDPEVLQFYQGRRRLEDIWEFIVQLVQDSQGARERTVILEYLAKELREL